MPEVKLNKIGAATFIIGAIIAIVLGIGSALAAAWATNAWLILVLVVLGLVIGFLNITKGEVSAFLLAAIALLIANTANLSSINTLVPYVGTFLESVVKNAMILVAPAALVVSLKAVYTTASRK